MLTSRRRQHQCNDRQLLFHFDAHAQEMVWSMLQKLWQPRRKAEGACTKGRGEISHNRSPRTAWTPSSASRAGASSALTASDAAANISAESTAFDAEKIKIAGGRLWNDILGTLMQLQEVPTLVAQIEDDIDSLAAMSQVRVCLHCLGWRSHPAK